MRRVVTVLLLALLMAEVFGVTDASLARERQPATNEADRRAVVERLKTIPVKSVVTVERTDGTKLTALLEAVTSEAITVSVLVKETATVEEHTISIDQIRKIQKKTGMGLRILKGVGIGVGVCTGVVLVAGAAAG